MDREFLSRRRLLTLSAATLAGCGSDPPSSRTTATASGTTTGTTTGTVSTPDYDTGLDHDASAWRGYDPDWTAPATNPEGALAVEVLVENLAIPWDLSVAPNGDIFLTERTGRILRYREGDVVDVTRPRGIIEAGAMPPGSDERSWFVDGGEGGAMGIAVHRNYPEVPLLYVYYTAETADGLVNRLAYVDVSTATPRRHAKTLLEVPAGRIHNGGRLTFGPANYLWLTTGDSGDHALAADPTSLAGKVLRLTPEGAAAPGNNDRADADPRVFSMGHRNPQGVGWLPDATPVVDEHGPGPDEVSVLAAGGDYGWPAARRPEAYADTAYRRPVASSLVEERTWAPSGSVFYRGEALPGLRNRLLVGCLAGQRLKAFTLTPPGGDAPPLGETGARHDADWLDGAYAVTSHALLRDEIGRIRHVEEGPDGALYAITSNRDGRATGRFPRQRDDVLVRITAGESGADAGTGTTPATDTTG